MLGASVVSAIRELAWDNKFKILTPSSQQLDLTSENETAKYFGIHKPEVVVHLAAKVMGLRGNMDNQIQSMRQNSRINESLFLAATKYPPKQIFFAGTVASYAFPYQSLPLREEYFLGGDVHAGEFGYAWAKRSAYPWLRLLSEELGVSWTYALFTNLFGPNDRFIGPHTHVIPALIHKAFESKRSKSSKSLDVWGHPEVTRDFLYAPEAARASLIAIENSSQKGLIVNIASGVETSMKNVAESVAAHFEIENVSWDSAQPIGVPNRSMNIDKLLSFGFQPKTDLHEQLGKTIEWYLTNPSLVR
jgi:GDP-L-fucose synthase